MTRIPHAKGVTTCAAAVMLSIPVVVLYALFQRHFIQGVLSGALKG